VVCLKLRRGRETLLALDAFQQLADPRQHTEFLAESAALRARAIDLTGTLELATEPAASVRVDEEPHALPPSTEHHLQLDPGVHTLHIDAAGRAHEARQLSLSVGELRRERVVLQPVASPQVISAPSMAQSVAPTRDDRRRVRAWWWAGGAAVVVAVVATGVALAVRDDDSRPRASAGSSGVLF
jgi:hypothetical protein